MTTLDLALVGNGTIGGLIDPGGSVVWACFPRFDGDPAFCTLLGGAGEFSVELADSTRQEQEYLPNTPILVTRLFDESGGAVEITDFAPRFRQFGRLFCPMMLVRRIKRIAGNPRVRIRLRPTYGSGRDRRTTTYVSNHVRFEGARDDPVLRLTTDVPVTAIVEENSFLLEDPATVLLG